MNENRCCNKRRNRTDEILLSMKSKFKEEAKSKDKRKLGTGEKILSSLMGSYYSDFGQEKICMLSMSYSMVEYKDRLPEGSRQDALREIMMIMFNQGDSG
ncbi:hypothetical protein Tco_0770749 [Tanacetum coccineum]|uniref:Uncharacterized protein n=1 Tax=Tanacetum coccineum TaxID=301880 RepID=A0ABQ4ZGU1_9ASTR